MTEANRQLVEQIFRDARYIQLLGIELVAFGFGWCETRLQVSDRLRQQHGFIHAGVLMTIADHTCGGAAASTMPADKDVITVENKVSFLRPAAASVLICKAKVLRAGKTLIFAEAETFIDRDNEPTLISKTSSTLAVIPRRAMEE